METATIIALAGFVVQFVIAIVGATLGIRNVNAKVQSSVDTKIDLMTNRIVTTELAAERRIGQVDAGLRVRLQEVELHIRDNFVGNEVFNRMVDLAAANNENQFRTLAAQMNRLSDKLDAIQAAVLRSSGQTQL